MASKKILVTLSDDLATVLGDLMREDTQNNRSAYIGFLIGQEKTRRNKKVGRPRKDGEDTEDDFEPDYTDDLPKNIPHFNRRIGAREYADIQERHKILRG